MLTGTVLDHAATPAQLPVVGVDDGVLDVFELELLECDVEELEWLVVLVVGGGSGAEVPPVKASLAETS